MYAVGMFSMGRMNIDMARIFSAVVGHLESAVLRIAGIAVGQQGGFWQYRYCHGVVWNGCLSNYLEVAGRGSIRSRYFPLHVAMRNS